MLTQKKMVVMLMIVMFIKYLWSAAEVQTVPAIRYHYIGSGIREHLRVIIFEI